MSPKVYNQNDPNVPPGSVYVGRPSKWGNPFITGRDGTLSEVLLKFRKHANSLDLSELRGKNLVCWCKPKPCHGDILLELSNPGPMSEFYEH